jgi:glycosyltransferase involved in cell wall biosynthesis
MRIVFLGNMNNLAFSLAGELKKRGFDVTFIVDAQKQVLLDRPESWDKSLENNYPPWIIERPLASKMKAVKFAFPKCYFREMIRFINTFDIIFLNGHWISLGVFVKKGKRVIDLFAGFDLDFADFKEISFFINYFKMSGGLLNKFIPDFVTGFVYKRMIVFQRKGIRRADVVNYYTTGINPQSDKLLNEIKAGQVFKRQEIRGFDCNRFPYKAPMENRSKFIILNITRFSFLNDKNDNKRNDIMIKGIGGFVKRNNISHEELEILFFEKGENIAEAKELCEEYGLTSLIKWQKQTSVEGLIDYFALCDVAFDQLGDQWVGAGLFSMLTGRPIIANGRPEVFEKLTNEKSPICQATNEAEVECWLTKLYTNRALIKEIGLASRNYVLRHYNIQETTNYLINCFE